MINIIKMLYLFAFNKSHSCILMTCDITYYILTPMSLGMSQNSGGRHHHHHPSYVFYSPTIFAFLFFIRMLFLTLSIYFLI